MLLGLYFRYMYPFAPLFIRRTFMEEYRAGRPSLSQILLLNAIFCNACWYSDDPLVKQQSTKYFSRAKIILDETYHVSQLSTIQALLMMAHHQHAVGNYSGGWLYTGMSIRIAHVRNIFFFLFWRRFTTLSRLGRRGPSSQRFFYLTSCLLFTPTIDFIGHWTASSGCRSSRTGRGRSPEACLVGSLHRRQTRGWDHWTSSRHPGQGFQCSNAFRGLDFRMWRG